MRKRGLSAYLFDYQSPLPDPNTILSQVTHLIISTPPDAEGDPTYRMHAQDIAAMPNLEWMGYLSTTGVYGNRDGGWVNETSELRPSSKRGSRRITAEEQWQDLAAQHHVALNIFRLAGIYGPGRSALDSVRAGNARRIDKPGHAFSRIHVEDIVQVLTASMDANDRGEIYNLCDDLPAPSHEVIAYACELLKIEPPPLIPFDEAGLAPMTASFYRDNKRVKNDKVKTQLDLQLKYPTYKEGLQACMDHENHAIFKLASA